jgi:hypothetical protein
LFPFIESHVFWEKFLASPKPPETHDTTAIAIGHDTTANRKDSDTIKAGTASRKLQ